MAPAGMQKGTGNEPVVFPVLFNPEGPEGVSVKPHRVSPCQHGYSNGSKYEENGNHC